jgi:hypothetical protein
MRDPCAAHDVAVRKNIDDPGNFLVKRTWVSVIPPRLRFVLCWVLVVLASIAVMCGAASGEREHSARHSIKIAPWVIEHTANDQHAEFIVILTDQADLRGTAALTTKVE